MARAAGTSAPIASRVLNDDPSLTVGEPLRERVRTAARELGYRPHALARSLRTNQTRAVGMLVPSLENPVYTQIVRAAFRRAAERDFTVLLAEDFDEQEADETFARLVLGGRIDGLLVASARPGSPLPELLAANGVPHVYLNRAVPGSGRNLVMDDASAARLAAEHLAGLGHRRLGHIAGPAGLDPVERRAAAFARRLAELGLEAPAVEQADFLEGDGARALVRLLDADPGITAVYASTVSQGAGIVHAARSRGLLVPRDLSLVAHADMPLAEVLLPPLTAVRMPLGELGAAGVDALIAQIRGADPVDAIVQAAPELVLRSSTGPPP